MRSCEILGHHMEPAFGQWDKDYADLYCTRCGHCEPGVLLIREGEEAPPPDPLVIRGRGSVSGRVGALFAVIFPVIPLLVGIFFSWVAAGAWCAVVIAITCLLAGDMGGPPVGGGGTAATQMIQGPLR